MTVTKDEKLAIIGAERSRVEHGLYAAEVDVRVSESTPEEVGRLEAAQAQLAAVNKRLAVCDALAQGVAGPPAPPTGA